MKFFSILVVSLAVTAVFAGSEQDAQLQLEKATGASKLDMKEVEKLLQQIEAEEHKPKPDDATVSESLNKLFSTFRQMTSAYINVLNAVNKSLGLPKYPAIPGLSRVARQDSGASSPSLPLRQIQENLQQLQETAIEVGKKVREMTSTMTKEGRDTVLKQFRRFTDLWSKQLKEISGMLQEAASSPQSRQEGPVTRPDVFEQISRYIQQVTSSIRGFANNIYQGLRNRVFPTGSPQAAPAPAPGPAPVQGTF